MSRRRAAHGAHSPSPFTPGRAIEGHRAERHKRRSDGPVPVANPTEIARFLRDDTKQLHRTMQLEFLVAQYYIRLRDARTPEGVPIGEASMYGTVADLEPYNDGLSLAILRTLADLAVGETAERARSAADRLAVQRLEYPGRFRAVGTARAVDAWVVQHMGEICLFIEFAHDDRSRHAVGVYIDPELGAVAKHLGITDSVHKAEETCPFHPSEMETIPLEEAGRLLRTAVETVDPRTGIPPAESDDFRPLIAAARARAMVGGS